MIRMDWNRRQRHLRAALRVRRPRVARIRPGSLPGTLAPVDKAEPPTITVITFNRESVQERRVESIDGALAAITPGAVTWINVDGLGDPSLFGRLGERLGLHPLALEDVLNVPHRPQDDEDVLVEALDLRPLRTMRLERRPDVEAGGAPIIDEQVSLFFGTEWVVTIQERADGDSFGAVRDAIRQGRGRAREAGADYLTYLLIDAVVDAYFPVLDALAERMQLLEEEALVQASHPEETLLRLTRLRHDLIGVRRAVWPMREEIAALLRDDSPLITAETKVFLRDVYDHAIQALEIVETLRETAVSVMELFLSAQNQRLNEVMKVLTVIATLFIPLTTIASIYGMNFKHMPELEWRYGYAYALGLMLLVAGIMVGYFKKRGWW